MYNLTDPFIIQTPRLITSAYAQHRGTVRLLSSAQSYWYGYSTQNHIMTITTIVAGWSLTYIT